MSGPKVSVLVPCFNREAYIGQCVGSVLEHPGDDLEVVCCDNASTDRTWELLQELSARDPRVRVLRNETNLGPLPNWRRCLEQARGEFVHWLWSDDYVEPGFHARALACLERAGADMCLTGLRHYRQEEGRFTAAPCLHPFDVLPGVRAAQRLLSRAPPWPVSPAAWLVRRDLVRRNFFDRVPPFSGYDCNRHAIGCDLLMLAGSALGSGRVAHCPEASVVFRAHRASISLSMPTWRHYEVAKLWFLVHARQDRGLPRRLWLLARALRIRAPELAGFIVTRRLPRRLADWATAAADGRTTA